MNVILYQTDIVRQESNCLPDGYVILQFHTMFLTGFWSEFKNYAIPGIQ